MDLWVAWLFGFPLFSGILLIAVGRSIPKDLRGWAVAGCAGVVLCGLLASFFFNGTKVTLFPEWWPNSGELYIKLDFPGLVPAFWTTASGLVFYVVSLKETASRTYARDGLFLIVLTAANLAFLAGNFVLRYVALEFAALGIAAVLLLETGRQAGQRLYLGLRLGDAGLLVAIMMLYVTSDSLEVSEALSQAIYLSESTLFWVAIGFLLAVWVKTGCWPLFFWQNAAVNSKSVLSRAWFLATVMPNLGFYLLYRTAPLMAQFEMTGNLISMAAAASALIVALLGWGKRNHETGIWLLFALQGALILFAAVHRLDNLVWTGFLLINLMRFLFFYWVESQLSPKRDAWFANFAIGLLSGLYAFVVIWAVQSSGEGRIDFWMIEASLALLLLWTVNQIEKRPKRSPKIFVLHKANWGLEKGWGFLTAIALLFVPAPLLFARQNISGGFFAFSSIAEFSLVTLPVFSPTFWMVLIIVWGASRIRWLEKLETLSTTRWKTLLENVRLIPEGIYNFMEGFLYGEGLYRVAQIVTEFSRRLYDFTEVLLCQEGLHRATRIVYQFSSRLYQLIERATFEKGLLFLVKGVLSLSAALRRMHTGRLRINLMWVWGTLVFVLIIVLAGTGG